MRLKYSKLAALALALILLLTGCEEMVLPFGQNRPTEDTGTDTGPGGRDTTAPETLPGGDGYTKADNVFSVNYNPQGSFDPLNGTDYYNEQLFGLLYEGLFSLSSTLTPEPVLCESLETQDGVTYTLTVRGDVYFHDGTRLTAHDVVYSLNTARASAKFSTRLEDIASVSETGELTAQIKLKNANYMLASLLDVPVIKDPAFAAQPPVPAGDTTGDTSGADDTTGDTTGDTSPAQTAAPTFSGPVGTGPYYYSGGKLAAFTGHRDYKAGSLQVIYLKEVATGDMADSFADRSIDFVGYDPTGNDKLNIHMVHETRYYDTTDMVYLGFNCKSGPTRDVYVRQALMRLVNLDAICSDVFENAARRSVFAISPALGLVSDRDEAGYGYSRQNFNRLALGAGLEDRDGDGAIDYLGAPMTLRLVVNYETSGKVEAAQRIVTDMRNMGINVVLVSMTFDNYQRALQRGEFEMYLAEVRLKADFDLGVLFYGKYNYGGADGSTYRPLVREFLAAPDQETRSAAALALDLHIAEDACIVPIGYKQRSVLTHVGVVEGVDPSQSNLYRNVLGWKVNLENQA